MHDERGRHPAMRLMVDGKEAMVSSGTARSAWSLPRSPRPYRAVGQRGFETDLGPLAGDRDLLSQCTAGRNRTARAGTADTVTDDQLLGNASTGGRSPRGPSTSPFDEVNAAYDSFHRYLSQGLGLRGRLLCPGSEATCSPDAPPSTRVRSPRRIQAGRQAHRPAASRCATAAGGSERSPG
ncbi:hypothetical protein [Actinoallomurus iriomotensis]|uniref:Uncharacterized protein n=1 Tax=Actinoallomurus iriomotensis TaxID=478107 RepID=A0A9W6S4P7_9ACTN|nr:hypothetical protein [Actinoallomurus iriomotensis]GLY87349.1 hypothetical protein Airi02_052780 [Actinoallomurus iriomotensis]